MTQTQEIAFPTDFEARLQEKEKVEEKLRLCLDFMKETLEKGESPAFRDFWACKKLCLPLFKENLNPRSRTVLWAEYIEISDQVRKLKEILNEKASFATEQLELAISALEEEAEHLGEKKFDFDLPNSVRALSDHHAKYKEIQCALKILNPFATRVQALRKEIINTEMRIRVKNRLFERLAKVGDLIFPRRKELIVEISELFLSDVETFVQKQEGSENFFQLKNEIKALQTFAKVITINTRTFSAVRQLLSNLWDRMKNQEAEQKKARNEKEETLLPKLEAFKALCLQETVTEQEVEKSVNALEVEMKELRLDPATIKVLRQKIARIQKPFFEKKEAAKKAEKERLKELVKERVAKRIQLKEELYALVEKAEGLSYEELHGKLKSFEEELLMLSAESVEEAMILSQYGELIELSWLKENRFDDERIEEIELRREDLKEEFERLRKIMGGSSLDIEGAMLYQEYFEQIKARLERLENLED